MFYFVPAWYGEQWGILNNHQMAFDDAVNHIRMFKNVGEPLCVLVNNYFPQLRHFLHNQDLLDVPVWSVFDDIQEFQNVPMQRVLHLDDFEWDKDVEFVYTPFLIVARKHHKVIANIILNNFGKIETIEYFYEHKDDETHLFDDRGFLSSIIYFDDNRVATHQDYVNLLGEWCIRVHLLNDNNKVEINDNSVTKFSKKEYATLDDLIIEKIIQKSNTLNITQDKLILYAHSQHNNIYLTHLPHITKGLSFFLNRCSINVLKENNLWQKCAFIITDTKEKQTQAQQLLPQMENYIYHLPPYDTRLRLGTSQRLKQLKIGLVVDNLQDDTVQTLLHMFGNMMADNKQISLTMLSRQKHNIEKYKQYFTQLLDTFDVEFDDDEEEDLLNSKEEVTWYSKRTEFIHIQTEQDVILAFETVRVIVDIQEQPDIFIQIAGISAGIPQINLIMSPYVIHQKNGYIIQTIEQLNEALDYYLIGLKNWNQALVYSVDQLLTYTDEKIVSQWKKIMG